MIHLLKQVKTNEGMTDALKAGTSEGLIGTPESIFKNIKSQKCIFVRPTAGPLRGGRKVPFMTTIKFHARCLHALNVARKIIIRIKNNPAGGRTINNACG